MQVSSGTSVAQQRERAAPWESDVSGVLETPGCLLRDHGCALHDEGARVLPKSKVDLYAAIRRDAKAGLSLRAVMRKYGVGYETVQRALVSALPEPRKAREVRTARSGTRDTG